MYSLCILEESIQNDLTGGDLTGVIDQFKKHFEGLKNKLGNVFTPKEEKSRKKRDLNEMNLSRSKREESAPEPEPEPKGDHYYCIKKSHEGNTVKSCLPKVGRCTC